MTAEPGGLRVFALDQAVAAAKEAHDNKTPPTQAPLQAVQVRVPGGAEAPPGFLNFASDGLTLSAVVGANILLYDTRSLQSPSCQPFARITIDHANAPEDDAPAGTPLISDLKWNVADPLNPECAEWCVSQRVSLWHPTPRPVCQSV